MRFVPGDLFFERYVIDALVGEGGMGEVYRAEDKRLGRNVALKVLRLQDETDNETWGRSVARMQREAKAVAALSHPCIVAVYDVGEHENTPFIAMEFIQGEPLRALVGRDIPTSARLSILIDVAKALAAAHHAGIVHRDVKPENVMVGDGYSAKILDFGIARFSPVAAMAQGALSTVTTEGGFVGTPAYMAPEQLLGEATDARVDQFAFGVVAYELFSGKLPFRSEKGAVSLMASILSDPAPPLENAPEPIADIIARALEKAPDARFESMETLVAELSAFVAGETISTSKRMPPTRPPTRPDVLATTESTLPSKHANEVTVRADVPTPPVRRDWRRLAVVIAPLVVVVGMAAWFGLKNNSSSNNAPLPVAPSATPPAVIPTVLTDLPIPESESAEAKLAFREGLQLIRDAAWDSAAEAFDRARKADIGMAAAHFRYAILTDPMNIEMAREAFRKATALRVVLSERDQALLDALEPMMLRDPSDYEKAAQKLETVTARYPGDAEIVYWYARMTMYLGDSTRTTSRGVDNTSTLNRGLELTTRCLELDPKYADCWQSKESAFIVLGRLDDALDVLKQCAEVSPGAVDCLADKAVIEARMGKCSTAMGTVRRWITGAPSSPKPHVLQAALLYHEHDPPLAVRMALDEADKRSREANTMISVKELAIQRSMAFGDLSGVLQGIDKAFVMEIMAPESAASMWQYRLAALTEMGKYDDAARVADEFFSYSTVRADLSGPNMDAPVMSMHAAKLRAGKESRAEYEAARAAWISQQDLSKDERKTWAFYCAFALPAYSRPMAEEALAKVAEMAPDTLGTHGIGYLVSAELGRLLLLVRKPEDALRHLEWSTRGCYQFKESFSYLQSLAHLGMALEEMGETKRACESYQHVLSYWGEAQESMMVKHIKKRAKALSCETVRAP